MAAVTPSSSPTEKTGNPSKEGEAEKSLVLKEYSKEAREAYDVSVCDEEMKSNHSDKSDAGSSSSEDYTPGSDSSSATSSGADGESSALEEEEGIEVTSKICGGSKFYKLKFEDLEEKRKQYRLKLQASEQAEGSSSSSEEEKEASSHEVGPMFDQISKARFSGYRSLLLNLGDADYRSDDDEDFNPMYCEDTLSDEEQCDSDDEQNTESEPEIETLDQKNRKTGETLKCIKLMKNYLNIPSDIDSNGESSENQMEQ